MEIVGLVERIRKAKADSIPRMKPEAKSFASVFVNASAGLLCSKRSLEILHTLLIVEDPDAEPRELDLEDQMGTLAVMAEALESLGPGLLTTIDRVNKPRGTQHLFGDTTFMFKDGVVHTCRIGIEFGLMLLSVKSQKQKILAESMAIVADAHETVHVLVGAVFGDGLSPKKKKFEIAPGVRHSGYVWERYVLGGYPCGVYTVANDGQEVWEELAIYFDLRGEPMKLNKEWHARLRMGIDADVFVRACSQILIDPCYFTANRTRILRVTRPRDLDEVDVTERLGSPYATPAKKAMIPT
ncbi:hypothetical protein PBRA_009198 [Plasmodiophora brassicae]|uniref:Uncharacterized protein n=1 Tax=Plasmodiophora brassicae TaxID=37360 RepID=A0A0G4J5X8_PLABS|nr:hypothetical protein PBRA_009198 [Plasmodiophora brassicae]